MKTPGPDHPITLEPHRARVTVRFDGKVLADTRRALIMRESTYPPVLYVPREDADMSLLAPSDHKTYCPYKGDAGYLSVAGGPENAVWTYDEPYPAVAEIGGHLAFYADKVEIAEEAAA